MVFWRKVGVGFIRLSRSVILKRDLDGLNTVNFKNLEFSKNSISNSYYDQFALFGKHLFKVQYWENGEALGKCKKYAKVHKVHPFHKVLGY